MVQRLVAYTEQLQLRSATQTGYRPELGTIHPIFKEICFNKQHHAFALQQAQASWQTFVPVFCGPQISLR